MLFTNCYFLPDNSLHVNSHFPVSLASWQVLKIMAIFFFSFFLLIFIFIFIFFAVGFPIDNFAETSHENWAFSNKQITRLQQQLLKFSFLIFNYIIHVDQLTKTAKNIFSVEKIIIMMNGQNFYTREIQIPHLCSDVFTIQSESSHD